MDTSLALTIIGAVTFLIGVAFNAMPVAANQKIMGDLHEEAVKPAPYSPAWVLVILFFWSRSF